MDEIRYIFGLLYRNDFKAVNLICNIYLFVYIQTKLSPFATPLTASKWLAYYCISLTPFANPLTASKRRQRGLRLNGYRDHF